MSGLERSAHVGAIAWPAGTATPPRDLLLRRYLILAALAALGFSTVFDDPRYETAGWLVALAFATFVLGLHRPAWLLLPVIITELTLYSYLVPTFGVAQRLVVVLLACLLAAPVLLRSARFSDLRFRRVIMPCLLLVMIATVINSMYSAEDYVFKYLRFQAGQVLTLVLIAFLIRSREELLWLARITLFVGTVTAFVAIWQHFAPASSPYGMATAKTIQDWKGRSVGFMNSPIALANQMTFVLAPLLGVLLCGVWRLDRVRMVLCAAAFLIFAALTFSYTRSAFFALGPGLLFMGLLLRGPRRVLVISAMVGVIAFFPMLETTGLLGHRYFRDANEDQSAATHEALWEVGLAIALDNAILGIGHEHFEEVALGYTNAVNDQNREISGVDAVGRERPHNDFLSVWMFWGIFALLAYLAIFFGTLRNLVLAARSHDTLIRGLAVGCAGGVIVYAVNSAYHNYMDSSVFLWMYAGVSVALARLAQAHAAPVAAQRPALRPLGGLAHTQPQ